MSRGSRTRRTWPSTNRILSDTAFWKKVGEEYQGALIITGSVLFTEITRNGVVSRPQTYTDQYGRTQVTERREYANQKGYSLAPKFVFIDGRTGQQIYSESFQEEALYSETMNTPALSAYFELMDKLLPGFLSALSTQQNPRHQDPDQVAPCLPARPDASLIGSGPAPRGLRAPVLSIGSPSRCSQ